MKSFVLLRHGKSDWSDPAPPDFERPLTGRGKKDARLVGGFLASLRKKPDLLLSSPAVRARQTAEIIAECTAFKARMIVWDKSLYEGTADNVLRSLMTLADDIEMPLIVGHNPMLELATSMFLFGGKKTGDPVNSIRIPTAGLLCLELDAPDWRALEAGNCVLRWMITPKIIK